MVGFASLACLRNAGSHSAMTYCKMMMMRETLVCIRKTATRHNPGFGVNRVE